MEPNLELVRPYNNMKGEMIGFSNGSENFQGYLARSAAGSGPGIIVIQEWWGLVPHIINIADRFAAEGFTALAPDFYKGDYARDPDEAATLMQALNITETAEMLRKAILTLMVEPSVHPRDKVGVVGFCMGGQLALFAAGCNPVIGACVDFYGIHPKVQPSYRDIKCPVLGLFAEHDDSASAAAVRALGVEMSTFQIPHEFHTYPGTHHAFFNDTRPEVYNPEASEDAWGRTLEFFRKHLGGRVA